MKVLVVKTSSLGDVVHTLPALSDASKAIPGIRFDWVIEEGFAELPRWHPSVDRVIEVALRRWRRAPWGGTGRPYRDFVRALRVSEYAHVIDAQGLMKSAGIARIARGPRAGFDWSSAREALASLAYERRYAVDRDRHAIDRVRCLFAAALGYEPPEEPPEFGLSLPGAEGLGDWGPYWVLLHATSWSSKLWPEEYWADLARLGSAAGYSAVLPWFDEDQRERATRIADVFPEVRIPARMPLGELAVVLQHASAVVAVDTGLAHLAGALGVPVVTLYGATDARLTGVRGQHALNLSAHFECAPCLKRRCSYTGRATHKPACFTTLRPERVWSRLREAMGADRPQTGRSVP
jgi:heptosyltransferase-1